jgi:Fur family ferric uptake transcriptional regulator
MDLRARRALDDDVQARLGDHEHRYTSGRRALVDALTRAAGPATLPELLALEPALALSSTYRNLAVMEDAGIVRRLVHGADRAHYELAEDLTRHHHHLICELCGSVSDVTFDDRLERTLGRTFQRVADETGFVPRHHAIDLFGRCRDCAA